MFAWDETRGKLNFLFRPNISEIPFDDLFAKAVYDILEETFRGSAVRRNGRIDPRIREEFRDGRGRDGCITRVIPASKRSIKDSPCNCV